MADLAMTSSQCFDWCARQYVIVNHADIKLLLFAGSVMLFGLILRMAWDRIEDKPFSDEWAERIVLICYNIGLFTIAAYLVYYAFYYEPKAVADIAKNMTYFGGI